MYYSDTGRLRYTCRSHHSRSILDRGEETSREPDPLLRSTKLAAVIKIACLSADVDCMPFERAWSLAWFGGIAEIQEPDKMLKGSNIQCLCSRLNRREYSIMALPNYVGSIQVDMTSTLDMLEQFEINLDWSAVGFTIKAIVMLNNLLRGVYWTKMSFIIMENPCFYIRRTRRDRANMTKLAACKFQGILSAAEAIIVIHATTEVLIREMSHMGGTRDSQHHDLWQIL